MLPLLAGLLLAAPLAAQDGRDATDIWLGIGLGAVTDTGEELSGAGLATLQLSVLTSRWAFGVRTSLALEASSGGDSAADVGFFFGRNWRNEWGHAMLATGVAATAFNGNTNTVGIPLIAEIALDFFPFLGGGVQLYANMNPESSLFGLSVFVSIGEVR